MGTLRQDEGYSVQRHADTGNTIDGEMTEPPRRRGRAPPPTVGGPPLRADMPRAARVPKSGCVGALYVSRPNSPMMDA